MDYEKNKESLAIVKQMLADGQIAQDVVEKYFPELAESEDEKIRNELLLDIPKVFPHDKAFKYITWLEKQGEQKCTAKEVLIKAGLKPYKDGDQWCILVGDNIQEGICGFGDTIDDALYAFLNDFLDDLINSQKEQKPVDKVEPKFKVGDFVVDNCGYVWKIEGILNQFYILEGVEGGESRPTIEWANKTFHLWTIQDAKDGDVLSSEDKDKVFLYNGKFDLRSRVCAYCGIYKTYDGLRFTECAIGNYFTYKEPYPATKEQRDLLFQKMKEAGLEWDVEKKKLIQIEKQSEQEFSDIDNKFIRMRETKPKDICEFLDRLTTVEQEFLWEHIAKIRELDKEEQKPKWNEEDKVRLDEAIQMVEANGTWIRSEDAVKLVSDWLKSLKERMADNHPNLTWEDIRKICLIAKNVHKYYGFWTQNIYEEILDRFNKPKVWT